MVAVAPVVVVAVEVGNRPPLRAVRSAVPRGEPSRQSHHHVVRATVRVPTVPPLLLCGMHRQPQALPTPSL